MTGTAKPPADRRPRGRQPHHRHLAHLPRRLHWHWHRSRPGRLFRHGGELELMHRSMAFAALALLTLIPLLIVVAAAPFRRRGFALWIVDGMCLSGAPAKAVEDLFSEAPKVLSTTGAFSVVLLALFGLTFAASVQTGYEKVWGLPTAKWHSVWRQAVWLTGLTAYLFAETQSGALLNTGWGESSLRITLTVFFGVLFFWWGQRVLLGGRIPWLALLPGAIATMIGLVGLRAFSYLVFSPLIVSNAITYGTVGTVLVVQSWLIGVGFVVFGGALFGRHIHENHFRRGPGRNREGRGKGSGGAGAGAQDRAEGTPGAHRHSEPHAQPPAPAV